VKLFHLISFSLILPVSLKYVIACCSKVGMFGYLFANSSIIALSKDHLFQSFAKITDHPA
jgi:hypothetical protein